MAAVHFTPVPSEPNTAFNTQRKSHFYYVCPFTKEVVHPRLVIAFLFIFMNVAKVFVC